jgi:hypothetical protein
MGNASRMQLRRPENTQSDFQKDNPLDHVKKSTEPGLAYSAPGR